MSKSRFAMQLATCPERSSAKQHLGQLDVEKGHRSDATSIANTQANPLGELHQLDSNHNGTTEMYPRKIPDGIDPILFHRGWVQSRVFMVSIIKVLHRLYEFNAKKPRTLLDVGPHYLGGTTLLQELHSENSFTRLKLHVSAIDLNEKFKKAGEQIAPDIPYIIGDVKDLKEPFDIVLASHVIEHVEDMVAFGNLLKSKAREYAIFACPWRENPVSTNGHLHSIDKKLPFRLGAEGIEIYTDFSWGLDQECAIFWCKGMAK